MFPIDNITLDYPRLTGRMAERTGIWGSTPILVSMLALPADLPGGA